MELERSAPKSLVIISDLHVGDAARSSDLSRPNTATDKPDGFIDEFTSYVGQAALRPDLLLIAGDITNRAHPVEFQIAGRAIERLTNALGLTFPDDVVVVPGNHDVNWKSISQFPEDTTAYSIRSRYYPLRFDDWPFDRMMASNGRHLCEAPYFAVYSRNDWLVVAFNSSSHDGPASSPDKEHFGLAPDASLKALEDELRSLGPRGQETRVFLVHHHVVPRDDRARDKRDPSLLVNSSDLLALLGRYSFDLVVHGHKHLPALSTEMTATNVPLTVFGAGSFSATISPVNAGPIQNYFHALEVDGRHPTDDTIQGRVRSWAYVIPEGWREGASVLGIDHVYPYGCHLSLTALVSRVQAVLSQQIRPGHESVEWRDVMTAISDLEYLGPPALHDLIGRVCVAASMRSVGTPPNCTLVPAT